MKSLASAIRLLLILSGIILLAAPAAHAAGASVRPVDAWPDYGQVAEFPIPLSEYKTSDPQAVDGVEPSIGQILASRIKRDPFNLVATIIFILAIAHTFMASKFLRMAHAAEHAHEERIKEEGRTASAKPHDDAVDDVSLKATIYHFLGEVEAIFGIWIFALAGAATYFYGWGDFKAYISHDRNFTEPMFVVIIMAIAATRPVLRFSESIMSKAAKLGDGSPAAWWLSVLTIAPILGSFITEPAAMTIGALILGKKFYAHNPKPSFAYATLGLLFVNISVGGTLTHFAAPPVLMVAGKWGWGMDYMMLHFGWKAVIGILVANLLYFFIFRRELSRLNDVSDGREDGVLHAIAWKDREEPIPLWITAVHLGFLAWTVYTAHEPALFVGGFLFFLAFLMATYHHQNSVSMKGPLLVGFFLAGLVVHGGCQGWWIGPVIPALPDSLLMLGSTVLTAFNDNAAITYLASQVEGLSEAKKYAIVAGAVTGGGLTVIANAPNPAGQSILGKYFPGGVSPLKLLAGAIVPTIIMFIMFKFLPHLGGAAKVPEAPEPATVEEVDTGAPYSESTREVNQ